MINAAVSHLSIQLNQFLKQTYALTEDIVTMSGLVDAEGHAAPNTNNKLVVFLTNLEKDTVPYRQQNPGEAGALRAVVSSAPLYLNLYVMIAANFNGANYSEALKLISGAIAYFQRFPVFDHQVSPGLDPRIEKLVLDIENLKIHELSNIWTLLGGKYLPSVLYKVRMVAFDTDDIVARVPNVRLPASAANH
ncbi:DUF4255 domain-containing protein [Herbaspirillum sp. RV1423]|uniref:DUF4255 domain-containing protein n=1 Tax=Herbaspirillum sp. RV1423 TaxID=1443993 RepID=UPI0004AE118F|nr:DUF4255 domain-containing protein [Herbaspirillum sp. RV1423]